MRTERGSVGFKIGELDGADTSRARNLVAIMTDVAPSRLTTNLFGERWSKLAVNCMANPLAGLSGLGSAEVRSQPLPRRIAIHIAAEVITVGRACGYEVEPIFGNAAQRFVDAAAGRGREAEIDHLNGCVCEQGRRVGVPTPVNDAVVALVRSFPVGGLKPDPAHLEPLARVLRLSGASPPPGA